MSELPPLLLAKSLDNFAEYLDTPPLRVDDLELSVYLSHDERFYPELRHDVVFIVQLQLARSDKGVLYHDVVKKFIEDRLTPEYLGFDQWIGLESDLWALDVSGSSSFNFYNLSYRNNLDDCEE